MESKILVAYASKYGSTREVAEVVAGSLRECGLAVDLQAMARVRTPAGYSAIVLGAPLYFGAWHKDALRFLSGQQEALAGRPVAIFALGPIHQGEQEAKDARGQLNIQLARFPWLAAINIQVFGGKYDPARLRFPDRLIAGLPASPLHGEVAGDARDWTAIRAWAGGLASQLQQLATAGEAQWETQHA